jgi:predicted XRE-type DNA-binding protein
MGPIPQERLKKISQARKLSQIAAARRLKVNQPKISALSNYRVG